MNSLLNRAAVIHNDKKKITHNEHKNNDRKIKQILGIINLKQIVKRSQREIHTTPSSMGDRIGERAAHIAAFPRQRVMDNRWKRCEMVFEEDRPRR